MLDAVTSAPMSIAHGCGIRAKSAKIELQIKPDTAPKDIASAKESNCVPNSDETPTLRAAHPSRASNVAAESRAMTRPVELALTMK